MDNKCDICNFISNPTPETQILDTPFWRVGVDGKNHAYIGRAYVTLKEHKPSLSSLSQEEWEDFQAIVKKLEKAYKAAFGAEPLNWACLMNNAYQAEPFNPHVHWHIYPRLKTALVINGITFDDPLFGHYYDTKAERLVSQDTIAEIATRLRQELAN